MTSGELDWSEPMLYPFLKRLERDGLVKSRWRLSDKGPLRKYYRLTKLGLAELETKMNRRFGELDSKIDRRTVELEAKIAARIQSDHVVETIASSSSTVG